MTWCVSNVVSLESQLCHQLSILSIPYPHPSPCWKDPWELAEQAQQTSVLSRTELPAVARCSVWPTFRTALLGVSEVWEVALLTQVQVLLRLLALGHCAEHRCCLMRVSIRLAICCP